MPRWDSRRCPSCGLRYRRFRAEGLPSWDETYWELRREHDRRIEENSDYHLPARRVAILGRRFSYKQELWRQHLQLCEYCADEHLAELPRGPSVVENPSSWSTADRLLRRLVPEEPTRYLLEEPGALSLFPSWPIGFEDVWTLRKPQPMGALVPMLYGWAQAHAVRGRCKPALVLLRRRSSETDQHPLLLVRVELAPQEVPHARS